MTMEERDHLVRVEEAPSCIRFTEDSVQLQTDF